MSLRSCGCFPRMRSIWFRERVQDLWTMCNIKRPWPGGPFRSMRESWSFRLRGGLPRGVALLCDRRPTLSCICTPARRIPRRPSNLTFVAVPQTKRSTSRHPPSALIVFNHYSLASFPSDYLFRFLTRKSYLATRKTSRPCETVFQLG